MTHVLNCQSDVIVVVNQRNSEDEIDSQNQPLPFQFCNSKSSQLLGLDLNQPDSGDRFNSELNLEYEIPQFVPLAKTSANLFDKYTSNDIKRFNSLRAEMLQARENADTHIERFQM